ncbi:Hypothetical protein DEACI_3761 [Acididesulfobacillus acetoxydans]|uniref:Uncharacterized protein n=1 Tax=Acididesulfobacillus acetoxydans TaxID=1561005 RepID=A0A8S0W595_9FIRM|nr:hypothetical protein [Acididesulfobacillus acetoxydans]CAA7602938.1 Hypothetical protein DEACI_3761 [Acididesulfobacillus acetoxydans]CEJ05820.1 Hypothetical protein DEACI_0240 [Acididesulfobacillus acetoxydans]
MAEYYRYLWLSTWPAVIAVILVWLFVLCRLAGKARRTWRRERDAWGFLVLLGKSMVWIGVVAGCTAMFVMNDADWFRQPASCQGTVLSKEAVGGRYSFQIGAAGRKADGKGAGAVRELFLDQTTYRLLSVGERVSVVYLPVAKETVSLRILAAGRDLVYKSP